MQYTYPGGKHLALTFSYDDGQIFDRRLAALFDKYGMKATFHLNSGRIGTKEHGRTFIGEEDLRTIYANHEIACHGVEHKDPLLLTEQQLLMEFGEDRRTLEALTGRMIQGLSYAYGRYSDVVKRVAGTVGLKYSRTVNSTRDFMVPADFMEWNPTCHHADERLMEIGRNLLNSPEYRVMPLMYVWGHSYEFDRDDNWNLMEEFCELMHGRDDVWYATNLEICDYVNAVRGLTYSMDGKKIYNPSVISVWIKDGEKLLECKPGETICL